MRKIDKTKKNKKKHFTYTKKNKLPESQSPNYLNNCDHKPVIFVSQEQVTHSRRSYRMLYTVPCGQINQRYRSCQRLSKSWIWGDIKLGCLIIFCYISLTNQPLAPLSYQTGDTLRARKPWVQLKFITIEIIQFNAKIWFITDNIWQCSGVCLGIWTCECGCV